MIYLTVKLDVGLALFLVVLGLVASLSDSLLQHCRLSTTTALLVPYPLSTHNSLLLGRWKKGTAQGLSSRSTWGYQGRGRGARTGRGRGGRGRGRGRGGRGGRGRTMPLKRPDLFALFDPTKPKDVDKRTFRINEISDDRVLAAILKSWALSDAPDAGDRCYEVIQHLLKESSRSDDRGSCQLFPDSFIFGCVINAYARRKQVARAESVLREMIDLGISPDATMFTMVMRGWSKSHADDAPEQCERLLAEMQRLALASGEKKLAPDAICYSTVIDAYARRGRPTEAEKLLRVMWNGPAVAYPDIITVNSVMNAWVRSDAVDAPEQCERLLADMKQTAAATGRMELFPDTITYSTVMDAYIKRGRPTEAENVFREMLADRLKPSLFSLNRLLNAWSKSDLTDAPLRCISLLSEMRQLSSEIGSKEVAPNAISYTCAIDAYARRGHPTEAENLLRDMLRNGVKPNEVSFSSVMNAWSKSDAPDAPERCMKLLAELKQLASTTGIEELVPNAIAYSTVIDACARRGLPTEAETVLREMLSDGIKPNVVSFSSVMNAWARSDAADAPEQCERLLADVKQLASGTGRKDLAPNSIACNTVIAAYARRGRTTDSERVLREMLRDGIEPNRVSFNCVMNAWSRSDAVDAPEQCEQLLVDMKQTAYATRNKALAPDVVTYGTLIDAYTRRGRPTEAENVLREMLRLGVKPDKSVFNSVINAWSKSDAVDAPERGEQLLAFMKQLS